MNRQQVHRGVAAALLLLGILLTARAAWRTAPVTEQIRLKLEDLNQMRQLQAARGHEDRAVAFFDRMPEHAPVPLKEILGRLFPGIPSSVQSREESEAVSGWTIRPADIRLDMAPLADIGRLLAELQGDGRRPPWQLVECQIKAAEQAPGYGAVTLGVRALEKRQSGQTAE